MQPARILTSPLPSLNGYVLRSAIVAALGGLLFGFDTAVISGGIDEIAKRFDLSDTAKGLTVAMAIFGTIVGSLGAGLPGDRLGARFCLRVLGVFFFTSSIGCALSGTWSSFLIFRFLGGIGIGGASVLAPVYIAEVSSAAWRGRLVGCFQFNIVLGILLAYLSNYVVGVIDFGPVEWRVELGVGALPAVAFFFMLFTIPQSPRWLVKKGNQAEARAVLERTGEEQVERELREIALSVQNVPGEAEAKLFSRRHLFPIFLGVSIAIFNQLSGINGLLYYLSDIFAMAGFDQVSGDVQSVAIGAVNLAFTLLAMTVIDRVGRRVLLLVGSVGTAAALAGVAFIFLSGTHRGALIWLLAAYIAFFAFSQGAVIWVYISEVFPTRVRGKGQALGCSTHWVLCAVVANLFPVLAHKSGGYPFVLFAAVMVLQFFVVLFVYPESKGVSLEALQRRLRID